jgi:hypothetical protein
MDGSHVQVVPPPTKGLALFFFIETQYKYRYLCIYEHYMYVHPTLMITSETLNQLDLKIHKVSHHECLAVDGNITPH